MNNRKVDIIMKICLINPSVIDEKKNASPLSTRNKYFINPYNLAHLGLGYIASVLEKNGYPCDVFELPVEQCTIYEFINRIISSKYDFVAISTYYYNVRNAMRIAAKIKKNNNKTFISLGGFLPTLSFESLLLSGIPADCCCIGEGEYTTLELVKAIEKGVNWKNINGLAYIENGTVVRTKPRKLIEDLDELPYPVRPFVRKRMIAAIVTSRGCYGVCNYCGIREFMEQCEGKKYRRRRPECVVDEIEHLIRKYDVKYIVINDGLFHFSSKEGQRWFDTFERLIIERNINVSFLCDFRANEIVAYPDIVKRYKQIGLYNVNVGVESFVQRHLDFYGKGTTVEQNVRAVKILEENEINYTIGVLIFNPITTLEEVIEYCRVTREMNFYQKEYSIIRPLSVGSRVIATTGTRLFDYVVDNGLYENNAFNYHFEDSRMELCYELIAKWSEFSSEVFNYNYLAYITQGQKLWKDDKRIRHIFKQLYFIDREFIETVCNELLEGTISSINQYGVLSLPFRKMVNELKKQLVNYETILRKYY